MIETSLFLFLVGFFILITGARFLVRGAVSVATTLNISHWVTGVVIVGIGTSIPELSISISSTLAGNNVGLGAIIGGNTFNLLVILGVTALVSPVFIRYEWYKDIIINFAVVLIAALTVLLPVIGDPNYVGLSRGEGIFLLILFAVWFTFMLKRKAIKDDGVDYQVLTIFSSFVIIIAGIAGVFIGGQWVVQGAEIIATFFSVPPAIIGLTVVGVGTSLPEFIVSIVALYKKQKGIAVGNVIGSNIFGFLGILGITAFIKPLPVLESVQINMFAAVFAALIFSVLVFIIGKRGILSRGEGILLLFSYAAYLIFIFTNINI